MQRRAYNQACSGRRFGNVRVLCRTARRFPVSVAKPVYAYVGSIASDEANHLQSTHFYDHSGFAIDANTGSIWPVNLTGSDSYQTYGITGGSGAGGAFVFSLGAHGGFARLYCRKIDPSTGSFVDVHTVDLGNDGGQLLFVHPFGKIPIHEPHQLAKQPDLCCRLPSSIPAPGAFRKARVHRGHHIPIVIEPPGNVAYATAYHTGDLLAYSVNQNDGSLAPLQTLNADATYLDNRSPWSRAVRT